MAGVWAEYEVELVVADYFAMLKKELTGESYNKSEHRRALLPLLNNRSEASIEFKHRNISEAVNDIGIPHIPGYRPASNYQKILSTKINEYLIEDTSVQELLNHDLEKDILLPSIESILNAHVEPPPVGRKQRVQTHSRKANKPKIDYLMLEAQNQKIGLVGEKFILQYEKARLIKEGKARLADNVEHISQTQGDGFGFDILSFQADEREKFIEVKSTKNAAETPFYFTSNELAFSKENAASYYVYRVFGLRSVPEFFILNGALDKVVASQPHQYRAWLK